ncbi:MAG: EamA family transporter [Sedimentisphaerales bacterium]|nr:EamA family transporter [Sedimentisphaerales bacterium]
MIQAILTTVLFAMSAVSAGRTTRVLGAGTANLARLTLATLFLGLWAHTGGQGFHGAALPWMIASGLVGFALGDTALYAAYYRIGPRLAVLLCLCLAAPIGAIIEWFWLGTRLTGGQIFWGSAILVGVFAALAPDSRTPVPTRTWLVGIALGVVAALGQGGGAVLTVKAFDVAKGVGQHIDGATAAYQRIVAGLLVTAIAVLGHRWRKGPATAGDKPSLDHPWRRVWPWVVANALFGPALGVACISWALAVAPTGIVLAIVATTPLVVIPFTMILDRDRPTLRSLAGGAVAVLGAAALAYN